MNYLAQWRYGDVQPMPGPVTAMTGKTIPILTRQRKPSQSAMRTQNPAYFTNVTITRQSQLTSTATFGLRFLNVRSVRNKALTVKNFTVDHALDAFMIIETWLRPGNEDACSRNWNFISYRLSFFHVSQHDSIIFGGGVEFLFKEYLDLNTHISEKVETFELMDSSNRKRFPCLHSLI